MWETLRLFLFYISGCDSQDCWVIPESLSSPRDTPPTHTHPICHSVCPCMDFTTAESKSWHTYCREEGGRFTTCNYSYFHRFIWTVKKLYLNTCRTHSRDSEPEIQIFKYLETEDFKALLSSEQYCTHLLTLRFAASLYGRTWQQSSSTLLSGTSPCRNTRRFRV